MRYRGVHRRPSDHHRRLADVAAAILFFTVAGCSGATPSTGGSSAGASAAARSTATVPSAAAKPKTDLVTDIDVGGRTLHLVCVGPTDTGEPTVVQPAVVVDTIDGVLAALDR